MVLEEPLVLVQNSNFKKKLKMKKVIYLLVIMGTIFTGCNPLEDINNEIDALDNPVVGSEVYTLTDDDYEDLDLGFGSFNSEDQAKELLPPFIADMYPFFGNGSSVTINYNLFVGAAEGVSDFTRADIYSLSNADYASTGSDAFGFYPNVNATAQIPAVLASQIPSPVAGQIVLAKYKQYFQTPEIGLANLYSSEFPADYDSFELISVSGPDALGWTVGAANVQGSGFSGGPVAVEEWLITPQINLTGESDLLFQITQEIDFLGDAGLIDILVSTDYTTGGDVAAATWTAFDFDKTLYSSLTTSEDFDFSAYDGQIIHDSPRWRVQSLAVKSIGVSGETDNKGEYFVYSNALWQPVDGVYYLSKSDFDSMGEGSGQPGQFNNFSSSVSPNNYLPTFLNLKYPFAQEDDEIFAIYDYFSSSSGAQIRGNLYTVIDGEWVGAESTIQTSLQFGYEDGLWVPDNTIRYTFTGANYTAVGAALINEPGFALAAANLQNFGNFNRTGGSTTWSDAMMVIAVGITLDNIDPNAVEGQKYIVTVNVYIGSNSTLDVRVIKEDGQWVAN
jgi:hypothetical protein